MSPAVLQLSVGWDTETLGVTWSSDSLSDCIALCRDDPVSCREFEASFSCSRRDENGDRHC